MMVYIITKRLDSQRLINNSRPALSHFFFSMTPEIFESIRLLTIIVAVILRMILMPIYLQAYLNLAYDRIEEQKKEAGRITNVEYKQVNNFHFQ